MQFEFWSKGVYAKDISNEGIDKKIEMWTQNSDNLAPLGAVMSGQKNHWDFTVVSFQEPIPPSDEFTDTVVVLFLSRWSISLNGPSAHGWHTTKQTTE